MNEECAQPEMLPEISRGLRSIATIPPVTHHNRYDPEGVAEPYAWRIAPAPLQGAFPFHVYRGYRFRWALNPRLISVTPSAWETQP